MISLEKYCHTKFAYKKSRINWVFYFGISNICKHKHGTSFLYKRKIKMSAPYLAYNLTTNIKKKTIRNTLIKYYIHRKSKVKFETKILSPRLFSLSSCNASRNENRSTFWLLKNKINVLCHRGKSTIWF